MNDRVLSDRIVVNRTVVHGKPHIAGTRIMVSQILDLLGAGKTPDEIISDDYFPDLTLDDVRACIIYASEVIRQDTVVATR